MADLPLNIVYLPRDKHQRPIPWFVHRDENGIPDFRVVRTNGIIDALRFSICWICGKPRGVWGTFVTGPMCLVNRISPEPPSHHACAEYAAKYCPFLSTPNMVRRERGMDEFVQPAGEMIPRNPGVAALWSSRDWRPVPVGNGILFNIGDTPDRLSFWAEGRTATREEILASVESGLPILRDACLRDRNPDDSKRALEIQVEQALRLVP